MLAAFHVLPERVAMEKHLDCYLFNRTKTDDLVRPSFDGTLLLTKPTKKWFLLKK